MKNPNSKNYIGNPLKYFNDQQILKKAQMFNSEQLPGYSSEPFEEPEIVNSKKWFNELKDISTKPFDSGDDYINAAKKKNK